ncbi:exonuclease SbcC [Catalinimonas alkaloidigena]|uniref:SbcC/MukB-like Walker B domain-containing protein n=1 Tax=Catalinimonas alkaloidigena TaxID=1075417 RepID=UPI002405CBAB|nr:SbcC/MukB-like Walker B domain-containing protein [Catalinimonas alkaloidigena]MDF9795873.1 exonuclease SbcC [Catalinimonas alkaloidigena]
MIPEKLTLKGLYSYREPQTIDFGRLTSSQLFGIFGAVGCGKSSILEAIIFVLFDRSDRLNLKDNRYYNMLNLQSDEIEIDFTFRAEVNSKSVYRFYFRAGRNRNNYDQVVVRDRNYYKDEEGNWLPIAVKDASQLLGMNYEHFMQTVIIPQGKFREFVDQGAAQRTQMLKELFNLGQYELGSKVKILQSRNKTELTEIQARLAEIGGVSEEEIREIKQKQNVLATKLKSAANEANEIERKCQAQDALHKLFSDIRIAEEEIKKLHEQKTHFAQKEQQLRNYNRAYTYFKERFQLQIETQEEVHAVKEKRKHLLAQIDEQKIRLASALEELQIRQKAYEQRETDILKCQDLEYVIKVREFKDELMHETEQLAKLQRNVKAIEQSVAQNKQELVLEEKQLDEMDTKLRFRSTLHDIYHWHLQQSRLLREKQSCEDYHKQYIAQIDELRAKKAQRIESFSWAKAAPDIDALKVLIREQLKHNQEKQAKAAEKMRELQIKEKLAIYADNLIEGKACPLCGSEHHPQAAHDDSIHEELQSHEEQQKVLQQEEHQLRQLNDDIMQLESDFKSTATLMQKAKTELEDVQKKIGQHQQQFHWEKFKGYDIEDINEFIQKLEVLDKKAHELRQHIQQRKKQLPELEQKYQLVQEQLRAHQQKEHALKTSIDNHLSLLRVYNYEGWKNYELPVLKESLERGQRQVEEAAEKYNHAVKNFNECEKELHGTQSKADTEKERLEQQEQKQQKLNAEIETLCKEKNFESLAQVHQLLSLKLDVEEEQRQIQSYNTRLSSQEDQLQKLRKEAEGKTYLKEEHEGLVQKKEEEKQKVQQLQEQLAVTGEQLKRMEERLQNSLQLQNKQEKLLIREGNLKELASLFKGSGFVRYVSSVYLDNLCRTANERFMKLTRNNLSLELNEDGEFIVRDFLNNGKTRLLKTLSGGQTFQAALCLALALAENVKTLNQAEQSFFFLDEGFGSLDKESLRLVFDTLKSLRQEQRIVGIISHVEELQQEIDVYLKIVNDKERGSLISRSWE